MARASKKYLIGLTGTIGSGKSLVAAILGQLGAEVIDTDEIARDVVKPGSDGLWAIVDRWGESVLNSDRTLNREAVAGIVFRDEAEREWLNGLLHPMIARESGRRIASSRKKVIALVVPLLFESGMDATVDSRWVVTAPHEKLIDRVTARDGCTRASAEARIASQMSQEEKIARANVVIDNSGDVAAVRILVEEAWRGIEKN